MNRVVEFEIDGRRVAIAGPENDFTTMAATRTVSELGVRDAELKIVLAHRPFTVKNAPEVDIDLVVAGHTHGGQLSVPFFGPIATLSQIDRHVAGGGLHEVDGRQIYVSRGLGMERMNAPRFRLNCRPELALLIVR